MPIPVVLSPLGLPVRAVTANAPTMQVASNGIGLPIRISDLGVPFVVLGLEPDVPNLQEFSTLWIDPETPYQGGASAVTAINAEGSGGYVLPIAGSTTANAVSHTTGDDGGFNFNIGRFFSLTGIAPSSGDGFMLFVDVTPGAVSGTQQYIIFGNQTGGIRSTSANYQVISALTSPQVVGVAAIGERRLLALEVDRVASRIRYRDPVTGAIQSLAGTNVALAIDRINLGQGTLCRIHRAAIVERPIGAEFPISFEDALTSFTGSQPLPVSSVMVIHDADGQSESLGPNAGGQLSPDGRGWRNVFRGPQVLTAEGLRRTDGALVTQAGSPLLGGYDLTSTATGLMQTFIGGNCPVGLMAAHMLARDGFYDNPVGFQFHGAGGQQVYNFDNDPATGTEGLIVLYQNQEHWLTQVAAYCATQNQTVVVPRRYWMQGGTDERLEKGEYTTRFRSVHRNRCDMIRRITQQNFDPALYIWQPGQVMYKQWPQHFRTDILDITREWNAVFVAPMYPILVADGFVHPGINETVMMGELDAWATTEVVAGRSWNLLPPTSVERSGNTITIPITVRSDETLTAPSGKYAGPYGGDPANLGLIVTGGGSITSASVSGGNIVIQVSGDVTSVQYAIAPIGADMRTFVDADGKGYSVNRGLIKTTLTKQVASFGGLNLTLERWVPAFEVAVTGSAPDIAPTLTGGSLEVQ